MFNLLEIYHMFCKIEIRLVHHRMASRKPVWRSPLDIAHSLVIRFQLYSSQKS
jgi:hypothetical protein